MCNSGDPTWVIVATRPELTSTLERILQEHPDKVAITIIEHGHAPTTCNAQQIYDSKCKINALSIYAMVLFSCQVNAKRNGMSAIHFAADAGNVKAMKVILKYSPDLECQVNIAPVT